MKEEILQDLEDLLKNLKEINTDLKKLDTTFIGQVDFKKRAKDAAKQWFNNLKVPLIQLNIDESKIESYSRCFTKLIKLSSGYSRLASYKSTLFEILKEYNDDLIIPIQTLVPASGKGNTNTKVILSKIKNPDENEYIKEALNCLEQNFLKASIVLGWCAAINRIR